MFYLVFILLIALTIFICNLLAQRSFVAPTFLCTASFFLTTILVILNRENWMIDISPTFFIIVVLAMFSFIFGTYICRITKPSIATFSEVSHSRYATTKYTFSEKAIKRYPERIIILFSIVLFLVFFLYIRQFFASTSSISEGFRNIYDSKFTTEGGHFFFHQVEKAIIAVAYISYFHIMNVIFISKWSTKFKIKRVLFNFIPILIAAMVMVITTDRNIVIRFFIYALVIWILFYQRSPKRNISLSNMIIFIWALVLVAIMVVVFYVLGKVKNYTSNFERMIGLWGGSGLYNFNLYVNSFDGPYTHGLATFRASIEVLSRFGIVKSDSIIEEVGFVIFRSSNGYVYSSNIHSGLQPFYQDFGVIGVIIFTMFMGWFFEVIYQQTFKKRIGYSWVFYAAFVYPLIYICIQDQFFSRLHLGIIYELFWLSAIYYFTYGTNTFVIKAKKKDVVKEDNVNNQLTLSE